MRIGATGHVLVLVGALALAGCDAAEPAPVEMLASHRLPQVDGSRLGVTVMRVLYGPGESSAPHTHGCSVVGYVEYGKLRMHVEGEEPAVYEAGETFYEEAGRRHLVSANLSRELPAQFVAWYVCDGDAPLASYAADVR